MQTRLQNKLFAFILLVSFLTTTTAVAEDRKPIRKSEVVSICGLVFLSVGMFAGALASGGAAVGTLSRQQGFFESSAAFEARLEENRERERPFVIISMASLGTGALLFFGTSVIKLASWIREDELTEKFPNASITIHGLPDNVFVKVGGADADVQNGSFKIGVKYKTDNMATLDSEIVVTDSENVSQTYKLQVLIAPGSHIIVPFDLFARTQ